MKIFQTLNKYKRIIRTNKLATKLLGPQYNRSREMIEIDITYDCNLYCINCNRSCRQAPSKEKMSIEQIEKFIDESKINEVKWSEIRICGGEPTLHSQLLEIANLLSLYKKQFSPQSKIQIVTNGYNYQQDKVFKNFPENIEIWNTGKKINVEPFFSFNVAPIDLLNYKFADYSNACHIASACGMGLTPYGYYACPVAGGIDRVLGLDIGKKSLPNNNDSMFEQLSALCKYCGRFKEDKWVEEELISPTWQKIYNQYKINKTDLTLY